MPGSTTARNPTTLSINDALLRPTPAQASIKSLLGLASTPEGLLSIFLANNHRAGGGMDLDFYWTCIRLHQVFTNVFLNNENSDAGTVHYQSPLSWILVGGGVAASFLGYMRAIYQYVHAEYLKSDACYLEHELKLAAKKSKLYDDTFLDETIRIRVSKFARSKKPSGINKTTVLTKLRFNQKLSALTDGVLLDQFFETEFDDELLSVLIDDADIHSPNVQKQLEQKIHCIVAALKIQHLRSRLDLIKDNKTSDYLAIQKKYNDDQKKLSHELKVKPLPVFIQAVNALRENRFMDGIRILKDQSDNYAYLYWLISMPVMIVAGMEVAVSSVGVIAATVAVGSAFGLWKFARWSLQKLGLIEDKDRGKTPEQLKEEAVNDKESARRNHEAKLRHLASKAHQAAMKIIVGETEWNKRKAARKAEKAANVKLPKIASGYSFADKLEAVKGNEALLRRFLGSQRERRLRLGVSIASWFSTFTGFAFITFFVGGALGVFGVAPGILNVIFNSTVVTSLGFCVGVMGSLFDFARVYAEQAAYEEKVYAILSAQYKNTNKSNMEVYSGLLESLKAKVAHLKANDKLTDEQKKIISDIEHTINTKPNEGLRYFEKFETKASGFGGFFSGLKQVLDGIYAFVTKAQTGIFDARYVFLASGLLTGAMLGLAIVSGGTSLIPFIVAAAILMVVVGTLGVVQAQLDRRQKHCELSIDTLPAQIKTFKKWEQQLVAVDRVNPMVGKKPLVESDADKTDEVKARVAHAAHADKKFTFLDPVDRPKEPTKGTGSVVLFKKVGPPRSGVKGASDDLGIRKASKAFY